MSLHDMPPDKVRALIRSGELKKKTTRYYCGGIKQVNIAILPSEPAKHFAKFGKFNSGPIPILYQSKAGESGAPPLCKDSDIRTDVPLYKQITNGKFEKNWEYLSDLDWSDMVTFYVGCSFSFNSLILKHKIVEKEDLEGNVAMFRTNVDCYESGPFHGKLVVSMIPIHEEKLSLVASLTHAVPEVHGAPVQFGDPGEMGIDDVTTSTFGRDAVIKEGQVPVFWCCGVTTLETFTTSKVEFAITHEPGHMFVTDVALDQVDVSSKEPSDLCKVIKYSSSPEKFSVISEQTFATLNDVAAKFMQSYKQDVNGLEKATLALSHAGTVIFEIETWPNNTVNLLGTVCLISLLQSLGKEVKVLCRGDNATALKMCTDWKENGFVINQPTFVTDPDSSIDSERAPVLVLAEAQSNGDHLINFFQKKDSVKIGMAQSFLNPLHCALCYGLFIVRLCPIHDRYLRKGLGFQSNIRDALLNWVPSVEKVGKLQSFSNKTQGPSSGDQTLQFLQELKSVVDKA